MERTLANLKQLPKLQLPSQTPKLVELPKIEAVPQLPRLTTWNEVSYAAEQRRLAAAQAAAEAQAREEKYKQITGVQDANDPYVLNSITDALFNRQAKEKRYGNFAIAMHEIPVLGDIATAAAGLVDNIVVQPWANTFKGDWKAVGINALTNFSETADILANPIKSLLVPLVNQDTTDRKYNLPWHERLGSGFGFTKEGRYNYDYDTGFWLSDFGLEIISDPVNLIGLIKGIASGVAKVGASLITKIVSKGAASSTIKGVAASSAKGVAKTAVAEVSEKAAKELGETLSETATKKLTKTATKKIASRMIEEVFNLRSLGTNISKNLKGYAKKTGNVALKKASQNLDEALYLTKGIVDDNTKSIINGIMDSLKANLDEVPEELLKDLENFTKVSKYTLADFINSDFGSGVLTSKAARAQKRFLKQIKKAKDVGDDNLISQLQDSLNLLLSDPASIKKYRGGVKIGRDIMKSLQDVELTDYLDSLNRFVQEYRHFKLLESLDKITKATNATDSAIMKLALMGNPMTQALYFGAKSGFGKKLGSSVSKFFIKRLTDITDWARGKTIVEALFEVDTVIEASRRTVQKFSIFSGEELFSADFGKEYAFNTYNRTMDWLRGFGKKEDYEFTKVYIPETGSTELVQKPINILALPIDEQRAHILHKFKGQLPEDVTDPVEYFYKKLDEVGHFGNTGVYLKDWSVQDYIKSMQVDEATARLQQLYSDFTVNFTKASSTLDSSKAYLKFINDIHLPTAKSTISSVQESFRLYVGADYLSADDISLKLSNELSTVGFSLNDNAAKAITREMRYVWRDVDELMRNYKALEVLQKSQITEYAQIRAQLDLIQTSQTKLRNQVSKVKLELDKIPKDYLKKTEFAQQYKQFDKILSPYFGKEEVIAENLKTLYEIRGNARFITHKVLESPEFQGLIDAFRADNPGAKMLDASMAEANAILAESELIVSDAKLKLLAEQQIEEVTRARQFLQSIDNYVHQIALLKQRGIPETIQEVYLDTLQNLKVKDAQQFLENSDANFNDFIQQMNIGLAGRYSTHHYTLDYYATKLLQNDEYSAVAKKYLSSNRTALDNAEFMETLYKANLLPELSKTREVIIDGKQVQEFVNNKWIDIKDRPVVYLDFSTTGSDAAIDNLADIAIHSSDLKTSWSKELANISDNETELLLQFYKKLREIYSSNNEQDTIFFFQNSQNMNIDFLNTRLVQAEELAQAQSDFELFKELHTAREWLYDHLFARSLNNIDLLKSVDGVPTVGKYYSDLKQIIQSNATAQARVNSSMMLYLDEDIFDLLDKFPVMDPAKYKEIKQALVDLMHSCNDAKYTWSARMGTVAFDGTYLIDGDVYKPSEAMLFKDESDIDQVIQSNEVYVPDKAELLELKNNRWFYKDQQLPDDISDSNEAVKYLKKQGIEYAPSWRALNLRQQLSTYPVLIDGNISMQTVEGITPVAFRKYIDTDIASDFFNITEASYAKQHDFTKAAQKFSTALSRIKNTNLLTARAEHIERVWNELMQYLQTENPEFSIYNALKSDMDIYHKFAVLTVLVRDNSAGPAQAQLKRILGSSAVIPKRITYEDLASIGYNIPQRPTAWNKDEIGFIKFPKKERTPIPDFPKWNNDEIGLQKIPEGLYPKFPELEPNVEFPDIIPLPKFDKDQIEQLPYPTREDFTDPITGFEYYDEYLKAVQAIKEHNEQAYKAYVDELSDVREAVKEYNKELYETYAKARQEIKEKNDELIAAFKEAKDKAKSEAQNIKQANDKAFNAYKTAFEQKVSDWKLNYIRIKTEDQVKYADILRQINAKNEEAYKLYKAKKDAEWDAYKKAWEELKETKKKFQDFEDEQAKLLNETTYVAENEARSNFAKMVYKPEYSVYSKSKFAKIWDDYDRLSKVRYHTNASSRNKYLEHIYDAEQKGMTVYARDLKEALNQDTLSVLNATEALKRGLDTNKVYAPVIQRHGVLGQAHIDLNDTYIKTVNTFNDGLELDTFLSCDKQLVNNLEDLTLKQVLQLGPEDLTSFVYHQGKGVVIIPVNGYLTDTTKHSFDINDMISAFALRYQGYEDDFIRVIKSDGDLIIYAKNYAKNMHRQAVDYKPLQSVDYDMAFRGAFGYPKQWEDFEEALSTVIDEFTPVNPNFIGRVEYLNKVRKDLVERGYSAKQIDFLLQHFEQIEELRVAHLKHHQEFTRLATDYDDQYSYMLGGYGRIMDSSDASEMYKVLPDEVKLNVFNNELPEKAYYNTSEHMFNFSILGRASYRKKYEHFATSNYQSLMSQSYRALNNNLSTAAQYASFYYNGIPGDALFRYPAAISKRMETSELNTSVWSLYSIFGEDTPPELIYEALKQDDSLMLSYLGVDKKGLPHVEIIPVNSPDDIVFAQSKGAILLPQTTCHSVIQTINNKRWANSKLKLFHKFNYFLKACMLISPGFIFRNLIDSTLKNFLTTKDASSMANSYLDAMDYYRRYQETVNMLFALEPDNPFRPDTLQVVFADTTCPLTEDMFMMIHNFLESGPSAGSIGKVSDFYLKDAAKPSLINKVYDGLLMPTKQLEQITRLSAYLEYVKKGLSNTDAFSAITKTHFDYATKTATTRLIELVIPFYSFQAKNFEFWLEFLNKNPALSRVLSNYFQSVWNWEEIDFERIEYYQSQLNHIMQANIQLNKQGLTLKVNPSFMDPINIIANPVDSFAGRISPIFKPIVDAIQKSEPYNYEAIAGTAVGTALSAVPGLGVVGGAIAVGSQTYSRYKSGYNAYQRTGSVLPLVLPSVFGSVKTPTQYGRASYTNSRSFMDAEKRRPRRVNIYNKYYTDTGKNRWKIRFYPLDAATVQFRIRDNYNRFR